jgi:hypothetical protein
MGIHKEVRKLFGSSVLNYIISARTALGYEQWKSSTKEERLDIISRWHEHKEELQSTRQKILEEGPEGQESGRLSPRGFLQTRHLSFDERKKLHEDRKARREEERTKIYGEHGSRCPFCSHSSAHRHPEAISPTTTRSSFEPEHEDFEQAIRESVAATSRGNPEEDATIERAIRASVKELQRSGGSNLNEHDAMDRAIQASIAEANRNRATANPAGSSMSDAEFDAILEKSIQQSLIDSRNAEATVEPDIYVDDDDELKLAIQESKTAHEKQVLEKEKTEEEIVLDYVKKQSLAEEAHRQAVQGKQKAPVETTDDHDDDLKRAIEESMKTT